MSRIQPADELIIKMIDRLRSEFAFHLLTERLLIGTCPRLKAHVPRLMGDARVGIGMLVSECWLDLAKGV